MGQKSITVTLVCRPGRLPRLRIRFDALSEQEMARADEMTRRLSGMWDQGREQSAPSKPESLEG